MTLMCSFLSRPIFEASGKKAWQKHGESIAKARNWSRSKDAALSMIRRLSWKLCFAFVALFISRLEIESIWDVFKKQLETERLTGGASGGAGVTGYSDCLILKFLSAPPHPTILAIKIKLIFSQASIKCIKNNYVLSFHVDVFPLFFFRKHVLIGE